MDNIRTEKDTLILLQFARRKVELSCLLVRIGESEMHIRVVWIKFRGFFKIEMQCAFTVLAAV